MFHIEYRKWYYNPWPKYLWKEEFATVQEATAAREVSGDLVVNSDGMIVADSTWLWDWEKEDPTSYAAKAISWQSRAST